MNRFDEFLTEVVLSRHLESERTEICEFEDCDDIFFNERQVESIKLSGIGKVIISVYGKDGPVPHFHLDNDSKKFHTCICIDSIEYFHHGFKNAVLNSSQKEKLIDVLKKTSKIHGFDEPITDWKRIQHLWNLSKNLKESVADDMPDYLELH